MKPSSGEPAQRSRPQEADEGAVAQFVQPGQVITSSVPAALTTVLGSCVSICLWAPAVAVGGMNHYVFPERLGVTGHGGKLAREAFEMLVQRLAARGALLPQCRAKIFGGATMIGSGAPELSLGTRNVKMARELLAAARVPIVSEDVGGSRGRKLVFRTDDGSAWVKLV